MLTQRLKEGLTVRFTIGLALATGSLAGCSAGVLDIGESDAGADAGVDGVGASADVPSFSRASVEEASERCTIIRNPSRPTDPTLDKLNSLVTSYPQATLRSKLVGGWLECYGGLPQEDSTSFQFTADGHWYTLVDDGDGGLTRGRWSGADDRPPIGWEGTYTFRDDQDNPSGPDGPAVYVATGGVTWFHPEFASSVMSMRWLSESQLPSGYVLIDP